MGKIVVFVPVAMGQAHCWFEGFHKVIYFSFLNKMVLQEIVWKLCFFPYMLRTK
jgi:hypothetical protein